MMEPRNGVKYFNAEVNKVDPKVCLHCSLPSGCHAKGKTSLDICSSVSEERAGNGYSHLINFPALKMRSGNVLYAKSAHENELRVNLKMHCRHSKRKQSFIIVFEILVR